MITKSSVFSQGQRAQPDEGALRQRSSLVDRPIHAVFIVASPTYTRKWRRGHFAHPASIVWLAIARSPQVCVRHGEGASKTAIQRALRRQ